MTNKIFFDTDCISSFLWVKEEDILFTLFLGRIMLPKQVYNELSNPSIPHLKQRIDELSFNNKISIIDILVNTEEHRLYHELAISAPKGERIIGKGEAAAITLAKVNDGIIASNNLKDISKYVQRYNLDHLDTAKILKMALSKGSIDEEIGNNIWEKMVAKRRMLPANNFTEYLKIFT